jgi:predicted O-linked N-acetylglucosamine transferase (SPINDLY family)
MATIPELLAAAFQQHQAGRLSQAEQLYQEILRADPHHADTLHLLGLVAHQTGRHERAIDLIGRALASNPRVAGYHCNLGIVYQAVNKLAEATQSFRQAVQLQADYAEAHYQLGHVLVRQGKLDEGVTHLRQAVQLRPGHVEGHNSLGFALLELGRLEESLASCRQAVRLNPNHARAHNNIGAALARQGNMAGAEASFRQAVQAAPQLADARNNLANALAAQRKLDEAIATYREALRLQPDYADAYNGLGLALLAQGKRGEAIASFQQALRLRPDHAGACNNLGVAFKEQGNLEEAEDCFRQVLRLEPDNDDAFSSLGVVLKGQARLEEVLAHFRQAPRLSPFAHSVLLTCLNYDPELDPAALFAEHCRWEDLHVRAAPATHNNTLDPGRRLRVGYVSPDLRRHPVAQFLLPILAHHDARQVEVICYADVAVPDAMTARLQSLAHGWHWTERLTDAQLAERVRADGIDILVDLAGHTGRPRLLAFASRPAPVQVTYLGYPNTTGLKAMDYRLTDAVADPPGEAALSTEQLVRLPAGFSCFAPPESAPEVAPLPALRAGRVTFGSFHNLIKLNARVLDLWCRILRAVPTARLLVFRDSLRGRTEECFRRQFAERGSGPDRVELRHTAGAGRGYLDVYGEVDITLDTFPWGGHTTACESLWMGVPVITLHGNRHAGRMVSSALTQAGLTGLIARTPEEYVALASDWAGDLDRLARLRAGLRSLLHDSALCAGAAFTRALEDAYRALWQSWCDR